MLTSPFALCRIYSNGRVVVMGKLTENEARHQLTRIVYKLRYRTKWKVLTQPRRISHGNGLQWCYVVDRRLVPVKTALEDAKIDQLYFKFQFEEPFELRKLLQKGREEKRHITSISPTCLRLQVDLPQRQDDNLAAGAADQNTCVWDAGIYLELELEEELARAAGDKGRYGTCIIYRSGKVAILGCCSRDEVRFAFESLVELL
ncbi:uncharacterized protein BcabD6B2_49450 [Babesia caballi]|uniref:Uncharacterized protein n=1 Tax=Babesia caballi TaxID=5871 RepID=A0AAV4M0T2_BABCB|nr:hypothetical protein BcabD6B2_49450 [Babesia caballi]